VKHPKSNTLNPMPPARRSAPLHSAVLPNTAGAASVTPARRGIGVFYVVEGVTSHAVALMLASIYFYTTSRFGWRSMENFLLAATLGVVYVLGALSAHAVSTRLGRRRALVLTYGVMSAAAIGALAGAHSPRLLVPVLLVYSGLSAVTWPALESLVSSGASAGELSRRLGVYNCVWSGTGAVTVALAGLLLKYWPSGTFIIPAFWHAAMALLLWRVLSQAEELIASPGTPGEGGEGSPSEITNLKSETQELETIGPEPELLRARTLALWMSRLALPATFVVISSLLAAMPTLPLIQQLDPATRTIAGSVWMAARWLAFLALGATVWWHTRPRALLGASVLILAAFVAITFRPEWLPGAPELTTRTWMAWIIVWQIVLGAALGLIYAASLYFGMVLSDGSTEHGGYHEALIGLGTVIGPGAGYAAERLGGGEPRWGVLAVAVVLALSVLACGAVAARRGDMEA
jgi:MFS family permease